MKKIFCKKCNFDIAVNNYKKHIKGCDGKGPRGKRPKLIYPWNKGLTKKTDNRVLLNSIATRNSMIGNPNIKGRGGTPEKDLERRRKLSEIAKNRKLGGHTSKKSVKYQTENGIVYLQSSYEHLVAIDLDKNKIKWIRPNYLFWKDELDIEHRYYPDFYLVDYDVYLDPKNDFLIIKDKDKIQRVKEQNKIKIFILNKNQLTWNSIKMFIFADLV